MMGRWMKCMDVTLFLVASIVLYLVIYYIVWITYLYTYPLINRLYGRACVIQSMCMCVVSKCLG